MQLNLQKMRGTTTMVLFLFIIVFLSAVLASFAANDTFDHRTLVIDGKRKVLISGAIHCPRSTPQVRAALLPWSTVSDILVLIFTCIYTLFANYSC